MYVTCLEQQSFCHALRKNLKFKLLYFQNKERYPAENKQADGNLYFILCDEDKNPKLCLVMNFSFLWRHVKTNNKVLNNLSPPFLCQIFTNVSSINSYNIRNSQSNCYIPRPRTESAKGSLHYRGSVLWKRIALEIRQRPNLNHFKINFIQWEGFFVTILLSEN